MHILNVWMGCRGLTYFEFYTYGVNVFIQKLIQVKACICVIHLGGRHYFNMKQIVFRGIDISIIMSQNLQLIVLVPFGVVK